VTVETDTDSSAPRKQKRQEDNAQEATFQPACHRATSQESAEHWVALQGPRFLAGADSVTSNPLSDCAPRTLTAYRWTMSAAS